MAFNVVNLSQGKPLRKTKKLSDIIVILRITASPSHTFPLTDASNCRQ